LLFSLGFFLAFFFECSRSTLDLLSPSTFTIIQLFFLFTTNHEPKGPPNSENDVI